ncbi:hypothetical protein ACTMTF_42560 [Nonomuraea sp. ZG12]|uniref:hypothetical protein n=1 Tax=Nonomuraea sp. ZG12 TaxID=3452207 RepID=UPI003F8A4C62
MGVQLAGGDVPRLLRRLLLISSLMVSVSVALPLLSPTWTVQLAGAAIGGVGFGAYLSVDQALVTLVLPAAEDSGRDLGLFHIALNAPQVVARRSRARGSSPTSAAIPPCSSPAACSRSSERS